MRTKAIIHRLINYLSTALLTILLFAGAVTPCLAVHGLAIDGRLKYPADFKAFDYVSAEAVKGGELVLHAIGSYDKMNPFTLRGNSADGLETLVFEKLTEPSLDEPFSQYGLLAKDIEVAEDELSVTFTLHEKARFADGSPVRADDVKFSVEMLKSDAVHPLYPYYYADIDRVEVLDDLRVRMHFKQKNRELPLIAGQIPVLSRAFYEKQGFESRDLIAPLGSGPYVVESFAQGRSITYRRNPDYWAVDHPVRKHMFNFDRITFKYYKDGTVAVEAFKAGEFDLMLVNIAKQWVRDIDEGKAGKSSIIKTKFPHSNNAGMQGFVMNTRRKIFKDPAVRQAIGLAFDFEWTNKTLFYNQYVRSNSYFSNSYLAAQGLPSEAELRLLEPLRADIAPEVFSAELKAPITDGSGQNRSNLKAALQILREKGWNLKDGVLHNQDGQKLSFEIILVSPTFERVMA
ncbi:MAG: extracellular solute-binding protein, partial [Desulfocapsaceae bacterium]